MSKVSQADIARIAQVSRNTVSLALRNSPRLPAATRERIRNIAEELGYHPDPALSRAMAALVTSRGELRETLALVYLRPKEDLFIWRAFRLIREGFINHARELGFGVDEFDFAEKNMSTQHLQKMLRARGIRGVCLLGYWERELDKTWRSLWENFVLITASGIIHHPPISHTTAGFFNASLLALKKTRELGYQHPVLIMTHNFDRRLDYQLTHGFLAGGYEHFKGKQLPVLMADDIAPAQFLKFLKQNQADCVITLSHDVRGQLEQSGIIPGRDIGLACLDYYPGEPDFAGVDLQNAHSGNAAVDLIVGQLNRNEIGLPSMQKTIASNPVFRDGPSLPPKKQIKTAWSG